MSLASFPAMKAATGAVTPPVAGFGSSARASLPRRLVFCADALEWMPRHEGQFAVITSLPDALEAGFTAEQWGRDLERWRGWFIAAARFAMLCAAPEAPAIFYQTDRKADGALISKPRLLQAAAEPIGARLLWHKIALRGRENSVDLFRPSYCHLMAFSQKGSSGKATADVFERGKLLYKNAMGMTAAEVACNHAGKSGRAILDPFCGQGSVLAIANRLGFDSVGIDLDPEQCEKAARLIAV
jgi:DNA methylase